MTDPQVLTRDALRNAGVSVHDIRKDLRSGALVKIGHGLYLRQPDFVALDPVELHRVRARYIGSMLGPGEALSHVSAAVVHGIDVWNAPLQRVHYTRARASRLSDGLYVHAADLNGDIVEVGCVAVTSVARTIVDVARSLPRPQAVAIGDAALRLSPAAQHELPRVLAASRRRFGIVAAEAVVKFLDGRSESVGESLSRLRLSEFRLPTPDLQRQVVALDGRRYRVDFLWDEHGIVGEFDGFGKYEERHQLVAEKVREDAIRDLGLEVIRWNWAELEHFGVVVQRFRRAVSRGTNKIDG